MSGGILTFSADPPIKRVLVELRTKKCNITMPQKRGGRKDEIDY
jgi:hypothetical protein